MIVLGILDFSFCLWAVFSRHFCDGIVVKHLFAFSSITAMLTILDPYNTDAACAALVLLAMGMLYWAIKHRHKIFHKG